MPWSILSDDAKVRWRSEFEGSEEEALDRARVIRNASREAAMKVDAQAGAQTLRVPANAAAWRWACMARQLLARIQRPYP